MRNNASVTNNGAQVFTTVDVEQVDIHSPASAIKTFVLSKRPRIVYCDVFIAGGGMGGIAAAIRAAQNELDVCVSEETEWIGGQMTAQGVSAFDENRFVETSGATRMYQKLRNMIRDHYRQTAGIADTAKSDPRLNPGDCWVSWASFEPLVGLAKLKELIADETSGKPPIEFFTRTKVVSVKTKRNRIESALAVNLDTGRFVEFRPRFVVDATELGDLVPMAGIEYSSGAESRGETGEPHAPEQANPNNVQDFTYPFVLDICKEQANVLATPPKYQEYLMSGKFSFLGYKMFEHLPEKPGAFWTYRRLLAKDLFPNADFKSDVSMINWESHDLRGENIIDVDCETQAERLANGKRISLGFLHWLQTEAPRDDGGKGYPELRLRPEVLGTADGLSKYPYIRESRRIKAEKIITETEIAAVTNNGPRAKLFPDSIGIGLYPIDIHGHQDVPGAGQHSKPFQIPLGSLVQAKVWNFLPACKNIGTTHVTNGAYRLHPIEWAIGEAAGEVAAYSLFNRTRPDNIRRNAWKLQAVQRALIAGGSPLFWFEDVPINDEDFEAIQYATVVGLLSVKLETLNFEPDAPASAEDLKRLAHTGNASMPPALTRRQLARQLYKNQAKKKGAHL